MKPLGWKVYETIGQAYVNPIIYVYDEIRHYQKLSSISDKDIRDLIEICFEHMPHRKERILDIITQNFPEHLEKINKYKILL